ncbi:MAG: adenosine deaminase [Ktedonobacteraceae bacterium]
MDFQALPKVELHLHLDCSLSYEAVRTIDPTITLQEYQHDFIAPARCTNLVDFLTRAPHATALMQTPEQLRLVTFDVFEQLQRDNLLYAEIRFAPFLHTEKGLTIEQVVAAVNEATEQASKETGVEARLILCTLRHYSAEQSLQTAQLVKRFQGTRVAALDIAGDEAGFPIEAHIPAFRFAIKHGLPRTAHAGEASGPQSVWETLRYFQPTRIGHGARSSEDPALLAHLKQERIHLELCPSSNLQTNMYETYANHPINRLYDDGLSLGVNTDTRTITNVTLAQEYERLHVAFGWDKEQFLACNLNALHASFLPESMKQQIEKRLRAGYTVDVI